MSEKSAQHPHSVQLTVASVARSLKFYRERLGFRVAEAWPSARKPVWASLVLGDQAITVGQLPSLEDARRLGMGRDEIELLKRDVRDFARGGHGVGVQVHLQVPDVDAYHRKVRRKRLQPLTGLRTQIYGLREFQVEDPDGYRLVFYTRAAPVDLAAAMALAAAH